MEFPFFIMQSNILFDIGIIIIAATIVSYFLKIIKQPAIPAYIIAGILIGPSFLKLITNIEEMKLLSELGIAFLLFMVGLEIDIKKLKDVAFISSIGGGISFILTFSIGFFLALFLNLIPME
ncbi:cation:proton antiporter, partial [bacterium]|nr:cation:proton antiporter [bacterium]